MIDIHDNATRSRNMSAIKSKNTKPELKIRKLLHKNGYRFRLHVKYLPGKPDIVLPKYKVVIQVNGCFWHKHNCHFFKWPSTRVEFWRDKIKKNIENDKKNIIALHNLGWRTIIIWECSLKGKTKLPLKEFFIKISNFLEKTSKKKHCEIYGTSTKTT